MYSVIGKYRKFDLPVDLQLELFRSMVVPVLLYGSEVWGYNVIRDVVILHIKFLKYTLGVQKNTCNDMVYGDLGVCPLEVEIKVRIVKYWVRLITGKPGKLAYIMYQCLLYLDTVGLYTSSWLSGQY